MRLTRSTWRRTSAIVALAAAVATAGGAAAAPRLPKLFSGAPPAPRQEEQPAVASTADKPLSRTFYLKIIGELRETDRARAALAHLDQFDKIYPGDPRSRILRAGCLMDVGDFKGAEAVYVRLLRGPYGGEAYSGLGKIAARKNDWSAAVGYFQKAVEREPISTAYLNDLGYAQMRAGDHAAAIFRLRQAAELSPDDPQIRNNLILALDASGETDQARALIAQVRAPEERRELMAMLSAQKPPPIKAP